MKHRLPVPHLGDDDLPDIGEWARSHGWRVTEYTWGNDAYGLLGDRRLVLRVTLIPFDGVFPDHSVEVRASSGATLIYDDTDRSMAVTLQPEPEDARPDVPQDAEP